MITVENYNRAPTATVGGPYVITEGEGITLTATASDPDADYGDELTFEWDLTNDGLYDDASDLEVILTAEDLANLGLGNGTHPLSFKVTDSSGTSAVADTTLLIHPATLTITASINGSGQISPEGAVTVNYEGNQTFEITANTGYHIADVLIDGSSAGIVTTILSIRSPRTIPSKPALL